MTEKLYFTEPHTRSFTAEVLSCEREGSQYAVRLSRSAFFPGGGGQAADTGKIGEAAVIGGREENGESVAITDAPLSIGAVVNCELDWEQRFSRMQQHSGEHILSGLAHRLWGCENVGFHMSADCVTIDFDRELDFREIRELEREANRRVWENLPFLCFFPSPRELQTMDYRSKKELTGAVRIVEIPGVDRCACCAPHVERSGEIGLIRIVDFMRHRGGVRLTAQMGAAAYEAVNAEARQTEEISRLLSAPRDRLTPAVEKLMGYKEKYQFRAERLQREIYAAKAASIPETDRALCLFEDTDDMDALRELVNALTPKCALCAVFSGRADVRMWRYIVGSQSVDLRSLAPELNKALNGRGGGSAEMLQGSVSASREDIQEYLEKTFPGVWFIND